MNPVLFHIYGPLAIHAYGVCIALGGILAFYLFSQDKKAQKLLSFDQMVTAIQVLFLGAYVGGRLLIMLSEDTPFDLFFMFKFWEPGFSILGSIIGVVTGLCIYLYNKKIPILTFADRISMYVPLLQAFGRLGCFFTGCCYGAPTTAWYAVTYTHENNLAPLLCSLHPVQLYSSALLFGIFLFLYFIQQYRSEKPGTLFFSYLILVGAERFILDFIRWDRVFFAAPGLLQIFSVYQWVALGICTTAAIALFITQNRKA